jgi:glycosyltransferase involved in cell wall biosynthesis
MSPLQELQEIQAPTPPRVAYFPDSFHEVNGVAHTSRQFEAFSSRRSLPFLCVRAGSRTPAFTQDGSIWTLELPRGFLSIPIEKDLSFDPAFLRHYSLIQSVFTGFQPDLVHVTGPSELGMLGAWLARRYGLPIAASWHTNIHEYAARRSVRFLRLLPKRRAAAACQKIEDWSMAATARFYRMAKVLYAPNPELCALLQRYTGRSCNLMPRGVDAVLFDPAKRQRNPSDREIILGFVGRMSVEKNVALLVRIQQELEQQGMTNFHYLIIGQGKEEAWLRERLPRAEFAGVLKGEPLAQAFARMDLFVFPSHTDTFGNVVLEALASGVPAVVTPDGGPPTIVRDGLTGRIVADDEFTNAIAGILADPERHATMRLAARSYALTASWDSVFEGVYAGYKAVFPVRANANEEEPSSAFQTTAHEEAVLEKFVE